METVLIIVYPAKSHFNSLFGLAEYFAKKSKRVVFLAHGKQIGEYVRLQGFDYYPTSSYPFGMGFEKFSNIPARTVNLFQNIYRRMTDEIYSQRRKELHQAFNDVQPILILIDQKINSDFIVLYDVIQSYKVPIVFIQTMLNTYKRKNSLPIFSSHKPTSSISDNLIWKLCAARYHINNIANFLKYWGYDDGSIKKRKMKEVGMVGSVKKSRQNYYQFCFDGMPELILGPKELEYPNDAPLPFQKYIGAVPFLRKHVTGDNSEVTRLPRQGKKIIYCGFGTLYNLHANIIGRLVENLVVVAKLRPAYTFLFSIERDVIDRHVRMIELEPNVLFLDQVDQLEVLKLADVFISIGGFNSIKESIQQLVPMLIYPTNKRNDHFSNGAKIQFHGLGLMGFVQRDKPSQIANKIDLLINDFKYKENLQLMKENLGRYSDDYLDKVFQLLI